MEVRIIMATPLDIPVRQIIELLVTGEYEKVARNTNGQRLDSRAIEGAIHNYGRTLAMPPNTAFEQLDIVQVTNADPTRWSIRMSLWTVEEGRSDLSIELTLIEVKEGYVIELDDIHVL